MFWVTFIVSGLTVASIPWVASHFSNRIAGYLVLVPVMMIFSLIVQYMAHGSKGATEMMSGTLYALPTLLVFGLVAIVLLKYGVTLPLTVAASTAAWLVALVIINAVTAK